MPLFRTRSQRRPLAGASARFARSTRILPLAAGLLVGALTTAAAAAAVDVSIPGQPLASALRELGRQTNLTVQFSDSAVAGMQSVAVAGRLEPEQALSRLLEGHGLVHRVSGGVAVVEQAPVAGAAAADGGVIMVPTIEVTATGTKTEVPVSEVPLSVSVVSREEMDKRGVQDFNSAVSYSPGIRVVDYPGGQGAADMYLRGFRTINFLGQYRDGLRGGFNSYDAQVETYGFEQIDVLRGPSSVLYGQVMPGGLVNMVTKRPPSEPQHELQLQTGSYDRRQGAVDLGGPLDADGTVLYRLTGLIRKSDTQVDHSPDDRTYIAPALTWKPTEDTSLTFLTSYLRTEGGGAEQSLPANGTIRSNPNGEIAHDLFIGEPAHNRAEVRNTSVGYVLDHRINDTFSVHSTTRYMATNSAFDTIGVRTATLTNNRLLQRSAQRRRQSSDQVLTDNNVESRFETGPLHHTVLVGLDYASYRRDEKRWAGTVAALDVFNPVYGSPVVLSTSPAVDSTYKIRQTGIYMQDQAELGRWLFTGGLRKDWVDSKTHNNLTRTITKIEDDAVTGRGAVMYRFDMGLSPYASYSTSFLPQIAAPSFTGESFDPTEGTQYEIGVKYQPNGRRSFVTLALFDITQTNVLSPDTAHRGYYLQTGEVRSRGVELEGRAFLTDGLTLNASYTYTDAEVTEDNVNPATGTTTEGNRMPSVPRHMASAWIDYTFLQGPLRGLGLGAGVRYVGTTYDASNTDKVDPYTLVDAAVRYDLGELSKSMTGAEFAINATNLLDKEYYTPGFSNGLVFAGFERQVLATLTYRW